MFPYEGPQNALRSRIKTAPKTDMPDLPMREHKKQQAVSKAKPRVRKNRTTPAKTWEGRKTTASQKVKRAQQAAQKRTAPKPLPPMKTEQPRDHLGRFARKAGAVIWGAAKGTVKAVKGTAKAVKSAHRTVKRAQTNARRRDALEHRERKIALIERERKAGLKRKVTRRKRK